MDLLIASALGFVAVALLHVWFARDEAYLLWLVPAALASMFVGACAINGARIGVAAVVGLALGGALFGARSLLLYREHQRRLETFALELGLRFSKDDQTYASAAMQLTSEVGHCFNVVYGSWKGSPVAVFGYRYMDVSEEPAVIELTCAATKIEASLPYMLVEPIGVREELRRRLDRSAGDAFERRFQIQASDPERAKPALPARTRAWLLAHAKHGKLLVDGNTVVVSVGRSRMRELPALLDRMLDLRSTLC